MTKTDTDIQTRVLELSTDALTTFCDDISTMFGVEMECTPQEATTETISGLKKRFKKLTAVNSIKAEGALNGTFHVIIDQGGLFTLSGVVVMLPENRIKEEIRRGSTEQADRLSDAIAELGNMMVGTWDRVFREELAGHRHFLQSGTFIGKPWEEPQRVFDMAMDEEFVFVSYEMTIDSYPTFKCGVIFPDAVFEPPSETDVEEGSDQPAEAAEKIDQGGADTGASGDAGPAGGDQADSAAGEQTEDAETEPAGDKTQDTGKTDADDPQPVEEGAQADVGQTPQAAIDDVQAAGESGPPKQLCPAAAAPSTGITGVVATITARQIMQTEVIWADATETVRQALSKMQQHEVGYLMVGRNDMLEGIVSRSDLAGAISPYLRPAFARWKRPLDDATLQIRISWIMTRPVRTVKPNTSLDVIMDTMMRFGGRCLPVIGDDGRVMGMVTAFDVFKVLSAGNELSLVGKAAHVPAEVQSGQ